MIPFPPPPDAPEAARDPRHGPGDLPAVTWGVFESLALFIVGNLALGQVLVAGIVLVVMGVQPTEDVAGLPTIVATIAADLTFFGVMLLSSIGGRRIGAGRVGVFLGPRPPPRRRVRVRRRPAPVWRGRGGRGRTAVVAVPGGLRPAGEPARADRDEHLRRREGPRGAERGRDRADHRGALLPGHPLPERPRPSRRRARRARPGPRLRRRPRAGRAVARRPVPAGADVLHGRRARADLRTAGEPRRQHRGAHGVQHHRRHRDLPRVPATDGMPEFPTQPVVRATSWRR